MSTPRIYCNGSLTPHTTATLDERSYRHLIQVLRLKVDDPLTLFDGSGLQFTASIQQVNKKSITVAIGSIEEIDRESPVHTHLYQGISKGERMDYTIQKATELGVNDITPLFCERTVVKLDSKRLKSRVEHWQGVAIAACEQSGRNRIPTVHPPQKLSAMTKPETPFRFLLNPESTTSLADHIPNQEGIALLVGPEGGLSTEEIHHAQDRGWQSIRLGPRILRTETAAVAALAAIQHLWGDL